MRDSGQMIGAIGRKLPLKAKKVSRERLRRQAEVDATSIEAVPQLSKLFDVIIASFMVREQCVKGY
jgi:hypothetical protein